MTSDDHSQFEEVILDYDKVQEVRVAGTSADTSSKLITEINKALKSIVGQVRILKDNNEPGKLRKILELLNEAADVQPN